MPTSPLYKFRLGLFITIALVLVVAGVFVIGKQKNLFGSTYHLQTVFKSVSGLKIGNNVRFAGITVGTIDDIALLTDTSVRVSMVLQKNVQPFIKKDASANISSEGLMGDKVVVISPGTTGQAVAADGTMLGSHTPVETEQIMASLKVTADNAAIITNEMADIMHKINKGNGPISKLIGDTVFARDLKSTMVNLKKSTQGLNENMEAAKHNFLLRGYFRKKKREEEKKKKELEKQQKEQAASGK